MEGTGSWWKEANTVEGRVGRCGGKEVDGNMLAAILAKTEGNMKVKVSGTRGFVGGLVRVFYKNFSAEFGGDRVVDVVGCLSLESVLVGWLCSWWLAWADVDTGRISALQCALSLSFSAAVRFRVAAWLRASFSQRPYQPCGCSYR